MAQIGGDCAKVERRSQIVDQIETQKKFVSILEENWARLYDRLGSLIREPEPQKEEADKIHNALVPLAEDLHSSNDRIHRVSKQIDSVLERLEL